MFSFQPQCAVDGPRRLVSGRHERHNYNTPTRSVLAQSDAGGSPVPAISVGAICSASAAAAGVFGGSDAPSESCNDLSHSTIQFFSSLGPTLDGRLKPDISAIDGVAITGAGRFPSPFFGTSAAAPHVAGIAALVLHAAPCLISGGPGALETVAARTALRNTLLTTADPLGGSVPNMTFGFGLANAFRAVEAGRSICPAGTPIPPPTQPVPTPPPSGNVINVNATITYQTMAGWEGAVLASIQDYQHLSDAQLAQLLALAVNELGVTRARLAIRNGAEGSGPASFSPSNDNGNPNSLDLSRFFFSALDYEIDRFIVPLRALTAARGESFYVGLQYVDHQANTGFEHWENPEEYAEFMLAVFTHMRQKYGFVPNGIDVVNEPDNFADWSNGTRIGRVIVATANKLQAAGFAVPEFIAPSTANTGNSIQKIDEIMSVSGAGALVTEMSFHRYGSADLATLRAVAAKAAALGKRTSMLEYWGDFASPNSGANYLMLHQDLTAARVSAWQQGVFVDFPNCSSQLTRWANGQAELCPNSRFTRQYTKFVRPGARRIDALSGNNAFEPVAFVNTNGRYVVVVKSDTDASFTVNGLPAGTYAIFYTTNSEFNGQLPDVTIDAGQGVTARLPGGGVLTIYTK